MSTLIRYLRLFGYFVAFSFSRTFEFRFDFYMRIIMDVAYYIVAISFFRILFLTTPSLGGWNEPQLMIFVVGYCIIDAVNMTLFANNMWMFPLLVNRGDLDYYLVRPVSTLFFISLRDFAANSFVNLLITLGMLVWAVQRYPAPIPPFKIALFLLLLLNGVFLFYCLNVMFNMLVFFTQSGQGYGHMVWNLNRFGERPDRIFRGWIRRIITTVLPFALMASFPTRLLIEELDWGILAHLAVVSLAFLGVLQLTWRKALRAYASASS